MNSIQCNALQILHEIDIKIAIKYERNITVVIYLQKKTLEEKKAPRPRRHCYYADDCCTQSQKSLENQLVMGSGTGKPGVKTRPEAGN